MIYSSRSSIAAVIHTFLVIYTCTNPFGQVEGGVLDSSCRYYCIVCFERKVDYTSGPVWAPLLLPQCIYRILRTSLLLYHCSVYISTCSGYHRLHFTAAADALRFVSAVIFTHQYFLQSNIRSNIICTEYRRPPANTENTHTCDSHYKRKLKTAVEP